VVEEDSFLKEESRDGVAKIGGLETKEGRDGSEWANGAV
jgi:hypothetical protein